MAKKPGKAETSSDTKSPPGAPGHGNRKRLMNVLDVASHSA